MIFFPGVVDGDPRVKEPTHLLDEAAAVVAAGPPALATRVRRIEAEETEEDPAAAGDEPGAAAAARRRGAADPGPGGFYDDLGNPSCQPHLVRGPGFDADPLWNNALFSMSAFVTTPAPPSLASPLMWMARFPLSC